MGGMLNLRWSRNSVSAALVLVLVSGGFAQAPKAEGKASTAKPATAAVAERTTAGKLDWMLVTKRFAEFAEAMPSANVKGVDRTYFEGVLANITNRPQRAIELLEKVVPEFEKEHSPRTARALRMLANSYVRIYKYDEANRYYKELIANYVEAFERGEQTSAKDDAATFALLQGAPAQTVEGPSEFSVPWKRSKLGSMDVEGTVNGVTVPWIVDTGANLSVVTESWAKKMGLKLSEGSAQTQGITGAENPLKIAVIPELKIGPATVKNVVALVIDLTVNIGPEEKYEIPAVLGYPVLEALGRVTLTQDGQMKVSSRPAICAGICPWMDAGSAMFIDDLMPLVAGKISGKNVLFSFDTGAGNTMFSSRYVRDFESEFKDAALGKIGFGGAGGTKELKGYKQATVPLEIGGSKSTLKDVAVLNERVGTHLDALDGNLGRDVMEGHKSVTMDLRTMRFELE
jgi:clan AA aspartic protease (TIGR02281 family)